MALIKAEKLTKKYGDLCVVDDVSLEINKGEMVSIVGASGAGKSTLLQLLSTLEPADAGQVYYNDNKVSGLKGKKLAAFRNSEIGFVFQFHHLLPEFTALENICIPAWIAGKTKKEARIAADELLELLGLTERAEHKPSQLSGGEQQRIAVARALINNPQVVFADEPSGNLDSANAEKLHHLFLHLKEARNQTFVLVTHNNHLADLGDRKLKMVDGQLVFP